MASTRKVATKMNGKVEKRNGIDSSSKSKEYDNVLSTWYIPMYKILDVVWSILPDYLGTMIATIMLFLAGAIMRGDWLFVLVHFIKYFKSNDENDTTQPAVNESLEIPSRFSLKYYRLENLSSFLISDLICTYIMYFSICGFLQWHFYVRQRDKSEQWKCQPGKFLSPEQERHEIVLGSINVGFGGLFFGTLACYVYNGGDTALYMAPGEYGWTYFILSIPLHFIYQDAGAYYVHRCLHTRFLYTHFHKWHHYYKQPTAFSATAMHPAEMMFFQVFMLLPAFFVPLNAFVYMATLIYMFYYGLITHSGIEIDAIWPWQPSVAFHDNHHQYFHVNFGFNTTIFDRLHGTLRRKDRVYNEKIFGGQGVALQQANTELKKEHARELAAENKLLGY